MTQVFTLYVIDEEKFPGEFEGESDQDVYDAIVKLIEEQGTMTGSVEMTEDDFIDAVESIDKHIGGSRFLPICAFNNSPFSILGENGDCPFMGYFNPAQTQELFALFEGMSPDTRDIVDSVYSHGEVFEAFFSAAESALDDNMALAVIHS